jgi:hypothetical protein
VVLRLERSGAGQEEEGWKLVHHRRRDRRARVQLLLRQRNLRVNTKDNSSAALPSLLRNSPEALRINRRKVDIEALDLSKLVPPLRGGLPMRVELENKKGREPLHNPALRLPLVRLKVKPGAESSEARELTRNQAVLPAGDRPLVVDKRNPRAERKKASKVLQLPLALNDANLSLG